VGDRGSGRGRIAENNFLRKKWDREIWERGIKFEWYLGKLIEKKRRKHVFNDKKVANINFLLFY